MYGQTHISSRKTLGWEHRKDRTERNERRNVRRWMWFGLWILQSLTPCCEISPYGHKRLTAYSNAL